MRLRLLDVIAVALLLTTSTTASLNPFTWEATESHDSAGSALLVGNEARSTSRLTEVSHASLPAGRTSGGVCIVSHKRSGNLAPGPSFWTLLPVIAAATFFLLGWYCGTRHAASVYALRKAEHEDQLEQQAKAAEAATAEAAARVSTALVAMEGPTNNQQENGSRTDAISLSPVGSICEHNSPVDLDTAAESVGDTQSSSNSAADPSQHHVQQECQHQQSSIDPTISQASSQAPHGSNHSHRFLHEPDPAQQQQPQQPSSSHSLLQSPSQLQQNSREAVITNSACRIIDQITQRYRVNAQGCGIDNRVQLVSAAVQALSVAAHHHHKMEDQRLQGIANEQSAARNSIIEHGQLDERAWRQAREQQKQLQDFKLQIADCLMCGLILMLIGILYFGSAFGYYNGRLSQCTAPSYSTLTSFWRPLKALDTLACYVGATIDLVGSVAIMLLTVYCIKRFGLLTDSIAKPMTGIILFLGVGCGWLGKFVIGRLGGSSMVWLVGYEVWVLLQVTSVWCVRILHRSLQANNARLPWQALRMPCFMLLMGVVVPVAVSACPFWANLAGLS